MAYFENKNETDEYVPAFREEEEYDDNFDELLEDGDYDPEEDPEEKAARRKERFMLLFGIGDFVSIVIGTVVILLLAALLFSLIRWLSSDISQTFALWQNKL